MRSEKPVFVSYARRTSASAAEALYRTLGAEQCFLDNQDIELLDHFPRRLSEALLGARLIVAFIDPTYFRRWYCLREWMLALAPWRSAVERGDQETDLALAHLVVVLPKELLPEDWLRLPPPIQRRNCPTASQTQEIAISLRRMLEGAPPTVRGMLEKFEVPADSRDLLVGESAVPFSPQRLSMPHNAENFRPSLHDRFVGRANDMWRLHDILTTQSQGGPDAALATCALQGMGGCGKTRLVLEYAHRFGPSVYSGGLFWLDSSDPNALGGQFRSMLGALRNIPDNTNASQAVIAAHLAEALRERSKQGQVLYIIDNLPETAPGETPLPLQHYCPATSDVSCVITTRVLQGYGHLIRPLQVELPDPVAARRQLTQGVGAQALADEEWNEIANWSGKLPLALEVLNGVLVQGAATPDALLQHARADEVSEALDSHIEALRGSVPAELLRGPTEAFQYSYRRLDEASRAVARYLAWLSPAPVPLAFLKTGAKAQVRIDGAVAQLVGRSFLKRVGSRQHAVEMHSVIASFVRSQSTPKEAALVFSSVVQRFSESGNVERDPDWRHHLLDLVPHLRWHLKRLLQEVKNGPGEDVGHLFGLLSVLQGLFNAASAEAAALAVLEICELLESYGAKPPESIERIWILINRGKAQLDLGEWEAGTERLTQARVSTEKALEILRKDAQPLEWAQAQNNLGLIFFRLGERAAVPEDGAQQLRKAVAAQNAALEVYTKDEHRVHWARTNNNLGNALTRLWEWEKRIELLEEAVASHQMALELYTDSEMAESRAVTQSNLGVAQLRLGDATGRAEIVEEAKRALQATFEIYTKDEYPLQWAANQMNLASVLLWLGEQGIEAGAVQEAALSCKKALDVYSPQNSPLPWALTQCILGRVLQRLAEQGGSANYHEEAATAFRAALQVYSKREHPQAWARAQDDLGCALIDLGQREEDGQSLREAVTALQMALEVYSKQVHGLKWAAAQANLGRAQSTLGGRLKDNARFEFAVEHYQKALEFLTREQHAQQWAITQECLGDTLLDLSVRAKVAPRRRDAVVALRAAFDVYSVTGQQSDSARVKKKLEIAKKSLAMGRAGRGQRRR